MPRYSNGNILLMKETNDVFVCAASSASSCELCRLLFNAANGIESAVTQAKTATLQASISHKFVTEIGNTGGIK